MSELWTAFHFLRPQWLWFLLAVSLIFLSFRIRDDVRSRWKRYIDPELLDHLIVSRKKLWRSRNPGFCKRYRRTIMLAVFLSSQLSLSYGSDGTSCRRSTAGCRSCANGAVALKSHTFVSFDGHVSTMTAHNLTSGF